MAGCCPPPERPMTMKGGHEWWKYVYGEYYDCVICPEYCSDPKICAQCPTRSKNFVKTVLRHIRKDYEELAGDARYPPER